MEWEQIRAHYERLMLAGKPHGVTQESVAKAGGLIKRSGRAGKQNVISKMMANRNKGPTVQTFVKAVRGLGLPLSEFFRQLERPTGHATPFPVMHLSDTHRQSSPVDDEEDTELALEIGRDFLRHMRAVIERGK